MKVVFLETIPNVAKRGEIKEVADGYAQNFLLPQRKVAAATPKMLAKLKQEEESQRKQNEKELQRAQASAGQLDGDEIVIEAKATEEGKLYAAIGPAQIASALKKHGHKVDKKQIKMSSPIKSVGADQVSIDFGHGIEAEVTILVEELL